LLLTFILKQNKKLDPYTIGHLPNSTQDEHKIARVATRFAALRPLITAVKGIPFGFHQGLERWNIVFLLSAYTNPDSL
jgi:hypothetical protein